MCVCACSCACVCVCAIDGNFDNLITYTSTCVLQVAEMHGELIELNERLQKSIQHKDTVMKRMKAELEDLRGPVSKSIGFCSLFFYSIC